MDLNRGAGGAYIYPWDQVQAGYRPMNHGASNE